jgi:hypothetical protein
MPSRRIPRRESPCRAGPWSADGFDMGYGLYQARARARLQQRRRKPRSPATEARLAALKPDLRQEVERRRAHARQCRAGSHERLRDGFRWIGGWIDDRYFGPFGENGLRSTQHPMLRLFVASTLRAQKNLRAGHAKDRLLAIGSKLVLLDHRYVSFNPIMRRIIRIDLDQTFASWDALRGAIQDADVPLPNLAVAHGEADGRVVHPHGYWLLAQAVCCTEHGRRRPQRLLRAVERGLVAALRPIGADPGGLSNSFTGKNPLSPFWSCQVIRAEPFNLTNGPGAQPGLAALADHVSPIFGRPKASAFAGETDVLALLEQSNGLFEVLKRFTFAQVPRFHPRTGGKGGFEDFAHATVTYALSLPVSRLSEAALEKRARRQAQYVWDVCERQSDRPNRGRCRTACEGKSLREKQQIGALAVAAVKRQQTLDRLIAAYQQLVDDGVVLWGSIPVNRVLADQAGVKAVRTVQKHRTALRAAIEAGDARRYKNKREDLPLTITKTLFISPSDSDPQALSPPSPDQLIKTPERSTSAPISCPSLSLLTILSSVRVMKPSEPFAPSGFPPAPAIPPPNLAPELARLVLFPGPASVPDRPAAQSPTYDFGATPPLDEIQAIEMQAMLTRIGLVATNWRLLPNAGSITFLPPTHPDTAPVPVVEAVAPAIVLSDQATAGPVHGSRPVNRTQRVFVPGFLEAQAAKMRHQPPARAAAPPALGRRVHAGGLLDQTDDAGEPDPSG